MQNKVNVITSYYNDLYKLDWKNLIYEKGYNLITHKKCDNIKIGETKKENDIILIPNYGKSDYAFFHYIVNNYYNLSEYSVFTKINWKEQGINFYDLINECTNYDYYEVGKGLHSYIWYNNDNLNLRELEGDTYINVDTPYVTGNPFNFDGRAKRWEVFEDWYNYIFPDRNNLPGKVYAFDHAHCFSVSKNLIQRHSIKVYQYLLERFHPSSKSWDYIIDGDEKKTIQDVSNHFADNFGRFYRILFTHGVDQSNFKIQQYF
ncbi:MAG: hypothetical protein ACO272_01305 [Candidatus Fonsibacter ubiquis]